MPRRFDAGPAVAVLGAAILAVALFLDWFDPGVTAWNAFESLDLVLLALAATVAYGALQPEGPKGRVMLSGSIAAFVVVVSQLIQPPPIVQAAVGSNLAFGAWLGLIGTVVALIGSVLVVAAISVNVDIAGRDGRRRATVVDRRSPAEEEHDEEDDEDDGPRTAVAPRPASGGSLFSRGSVRPADPGPDADDDTQASPVDPQATQAFRRLDEDDDPPLRSPHR